MLSLHPAADTLTVPAAGLNHARMKLTWKDHEEIAWALIDQFPDQDPLKLIFPKLHAMVCSLEEFGYKPYACHASRVESLQRRWHECEK